MPKAKNHPGIVFEQHEKKLLDKIHQKNGDLNITCGRFAAGKDEP